MERRKVIDKLIINGPFEEPKQHWFYDRERRLFEKRDGRRPAGYLIATPGSKSFDDPGIFVKIKLVEEIRKRVKSWENSDYPGVTGVTKRLLRYWQDHEEHIHNPFFFCQLEAIKTLIWLTEAPDSEKVGIKIPSDGGDFSRWCNKMATGTGKTVVMAMLIAWQVLNKVANPKDTRFSKNILVVAPGITVKSRLSVLNPNEPNNYYEEFNIVPSGLIEKLRQGKIKIINWHKLAWESEERIAKRKSVDKRGAKSDEAYVREVLGELKNSRNIVVINDEAHHAWRIPAESKVKGVKKEDIEESTIWIGGLDRINRKRGILRCFDFSATPFAPSGKKASEEALFGWIVSDFGLNDAIESGLVKTPRVVIRDNSIKTEELKSRLYHIYADPNVKDDLNSKKEETAPFHDLVTNAYYLLGKDWLKTKEQWGEMGHKVPPVMITVANRTETSARIKYAFDHNEIHIPELCDPEKTLLIDSKVLKEAESKEENFDFYPDKNDEEVKLTKQQQAELLRLKVDTIGKIGEPGEQIHNIISVGMLSEGWDAKTVTHIMGLRAFSSQLLCEQVVGRGLRRTSYEIDDDGFFEPDYVNIFGVPFTFLPHEGGEGIPKPTKPRTAIEPVKEKQNYEISWPNVLRIDHVYRPILELDMEKVTPIVLDPYESITQAEMAAIIASKPSLAAMSEIDLQEIADKFRTQTIIFETAKRIFNSERGGLKGNKDFFLAQLIKITSDFIKSEKIVISSRYFRENELKRRVLITINTNKIVQHIWSAIRAENTEKLVPIFDKENPIRSTGQMRTWHTTKPCEHTEKSHINLIVVDSTWEASEAYTLDKHPSVDSWVKNDHVSFTISYNYQGIIRKYYPDFIIKLANGEFLILETKGQDNDQSRTKRAFLKEWVKAVNNHGGFGKWHEDISHYPSDVEDIIEKYCSYPQP
ncbi:hypothetical protein MSMTP_1487 [Methanosarcina sp. MTP4]|uniref:BPTD_3080 family restriction endonuclease n=1 Tax=Methanosarcina sp. MTP4 TaxID=1434100 RepID=UPI00061551DB|nr:DEAD/DEAH box helicase family protein [Methanosarcina sp. MTP4]AKB24956.1 hypothetical protein MSMTP_1487 [Methanosarcina sp. MTP4]